MTNRNTVVVIGNEAGDADSIVSAVVLAFCKSKISPSRTYLPIVQSARDDFVALKPEMKHLVSDILEFDFIEFIDSLTFWSKSSSSIDGHACILTDHHTPVLLPLEENPILEIYDHHQVSSDDLRVLQDARARLIIEPVGSCCTLVAREFYNELDVMTKKLLFAVICLDIGRDGEKAIQADRDMIDRLENDLGLSGTSWGDDLRRIRTDPSFWFSLSTCNKLKSDQKSFLNGELVISTVRLPLSALLNDDDFFNEIENTFKDSSRMFSVLAVKSEGEREALVYCPEDKDPGLLSKLTGYLEENVGKENVLEIPIHQNGFKMYLFRALGNKFTRKQFAPILINFIKENL